MSGLRAGQSMASISCWSKKAAVSCAVWGGALSWTYAKLRPTSTTTSWLLPPWWIAPHTMTDGPRFPSLGWTQVSISSSPCLRRTRYRENRDSSLKIQCLHCLRFHTLCLLPHSRGDKVSLGHLAGRHDQYPAARMCLRMFRSDICLPNRWIIYKRRRGAEMKRFILTIPSSWRSSRGVEIFIELPRFLWCGRLVSRLCRKIMLMHPWDTPSILVTSRWELPSADNLTIRCSTCCGKFCGMIPLKVQWNINSLYRNPTLHNCIKVVMPRQTSLQVTTPKLTFFTSLESQWSPDNTDCLWPFNLVA